MRKVIQITTSAVPSAPGEHGWWDNLYALCDDGSVWVKDCPAQIDENSPEWRRLQDIPQEPSGDDINF